MSVDGYRMITAAQLRAARALLGIDQRQLAALAGLSVPTIQRMEASDGVIRGNVDSLMKVIAALNAAGLELIGEGAMSQDGGRGVRLKAPSSDAMSERGKAAATPEGHEG
jgi:transcriptional regulator with XRE-family HTH domain